MNKTKVTPWYDCGGGPTWAKIVAEDGQTICKIHLGHPKGRKHASLIAGAPELLAACEAATAELIAFAHSVQREVHCGANETTYAGPQFVGQSQLDRARRAIDAGVSAITKAKGTR